MFWRKTRDILVETFTIVQRVDKNFYLHESKQEEQIRDLYALIKECHENCPGNDSVKRLAEAQNRTLLRLETKVAEMKEMVLDINTTKASRKEVLIEWIRYLTITGIICGLLFGFTKYQALKKSQHAVNTEIHMD